MRKEPWRSFAVQESDESPLKVPSATSGATGLAGRYATALFALADEAKQLDAVAGDLRNLARMIVGSADLTRLIRSPVLSRAEQGKALEAVLEKAGAGDLTRRFAGVVSANRRLFVLPGIIAAFLAELASRRGEATAEVVSAKELSEQQKQALSDSLRRAVGTTVSVEARVDPGLLGGLVVKVGSRMVDSSLRTKLQQLRLAMKGIG